MPNDFDATKPAYEQLLAENGRLRQQIAELEGRTAALSQEVQSSSALRKLPKLHKLDPNAADAFQRPAYSRRTK